MEAHPRVWDDRATLNEVAGRESRPRRFDPRLSRRSFSRLWAELAVIAEQHLGRIPGPKKKLKGRMDQGASTLSGIRGRPFAKIWE